MKWEVVNTQGEKVKDIDLPEEIYGCEMNEPVLHSVVKAALANKRQGTHATKTRSTVTGSGKKPFRQKGTGNARQGDPRSPLFPGGAASHGPQPRDYRQDVNKKVRNLAMKVALSDKVRHKKLIVVDDLSVTEFSTKKIVGMLASLKSSKTVLLSDATGKDFLYRSARNIHGAGVATPATMNATELLRHESLVISESALKVMTERLGGKA